MSIAQRRFCLVVLLLLVLPLGAFLRLRRLSERPGWYPDEGSNVAVAAALAKGESAYLAFGDSSFINPHPSLFYWPLAALYRAHGPDMLTARLFAAVAGIITIPLLYLLVQATVGWQAALLAAGFFAVYPGAVLYNRFAFTYNWLPPLYLAALYALHRYLHTDRWSWLLLMALIAGLCPITDVVGVTFVAICSIAVALHHWRDTPALQSGWPTLIWVITLVLVPAAMTSGLPWPLALAIVAGVFCALYSNLRRLLAALAVMVLPTVVWALWMWAHAGDAFLFDLAFAASRTQAPLGIQLARILFFYDSVLEYDKWFLLGTMGLLAFLPNRRSRALLGGTFFLSLLALLRTVDVSGLGHYYLVPLMPLVAAGVGCMLAAAIPHVVRLVRDDLRWLLQRLRPQKPSHVLRLVLTAGVVYVFLLSPVSVGLLHMLTGSYPPHLAHLEAMGVMGDPSDAGQVTAWVNARTEPTDVVLASPTIAWLLDAHAADFQMALAAEGQATEHFPSYVPAGRWRFDPRLANADYVIVDSMWREWATGEMPAVEEMVQQIDAKWPKVQTVGDYDVYRNPVGEE
jgi:4-amino-4-deoxy-L-arabinose transferase-like glycosyltransferase